MHSLIWSSFYSLLFLIPFSYKFFITFIVILSIRHVLGVQRQLFIGEIVVRYALHSTALALLEFRKVLLSYQLVLPLWGVHSPLYKR